MSGALESLAVIAVLVSVGLVAAGFDALSRRAHRIDRALHRALGGDQ